MLRFMDDPGAHITRPSVVMLFLICVFLYYIIPTGDIFSTEVPEDKSNSMSKRSKEFEKGKKKDMQQDTKKAATPTDPNELVLGAKRYKLFEKKRYNFQKAQAYCKKMDGKLATTETLEEMRRLVMLLTRAKTVSDEMWVGVEKKKWKKHAWKDREHPPGMNPEALSGMSAMMMGGGKQEMCPALSSSTRALAPAMCMRELPFVCEFDRNANAKPKPPIPPPKDYGKSNKVKGKSQKVKTPRTTTMRPVRKPRRRNEM